MGNTLHAALQNLDAFALVDAILPFDNLLVPAIEAYWRSFYDCATSFALTQTQLRQICCRAACMLDPSASTQRAATHADNAFQLFLDPHVRQFHFNQQQQQQQSTYGYPHQQHNTYSHQQSYRQSQSLQPMQLLPTTEQQPLAIDALEFFAALAFISAASLDDKIDLLFDSWDMSEDGALELDEFTISLKSTLAGLSCILQRVDKSVTSSAVGRRDNQAMPSVSPLDVLDEDDVAALADRVFREIAGASSVVSVVSGATATTSSSNTNSTSERTITCEQFRDYCTRNATAKRLFAFFDVADARRYDDSDNDNSDDAAAFAGSSDRAMRSGSTNAFDDEARRLQFTLAQTDASHDSSSSNTNNTSVCEPIGAVVDVGIAAVYDSNDHGDEFLAVKPWKGAIVPPSKAPKALSRAAPVVAIHLDWIFGYSAQDARNNVQYVPSPHSFGKTNEIVYPAAAACVVFNTQTRTQRHQLSHTDNVLCVSLHPTLPLAASGEIGRLPKLLVWHVVTMDAQCVLQGFHRRGVVLVAFQTADVLVSIGGDDDHSVAVYASKDAWRTATLVVSASGNKAVPFDVAVHPTNTTEFVVCGQKYIEFWTLERSGGTTNSSRGVGVGTGATKTSVSAKRAILGKRGVLQPFLAATYACNGSNSNSSTASVVVGTHDGHLYVFSGRDLTTIVDAHAAPVNALHWASGQLVSGSRDGLLFCWDDKLQRVGSGIALAATLFPHGVQHPSQLAVRSVCLSADRKTIVVGTQASEIYEINAVSGQNNCEEALACGHFYGELWGLATHPTKQQCCTVGDDATLRIWDLERKREVRSVRLDCAARACAYSSDGQLIAVGLGCDGISGSGGAGVGRAAAAAGGSVNSAARPKTAAINTKSSNASATRKPQTNAAGGFVVFSERDLVRVCEPRYEQRKFVSDVKFSPDSRVLAVASHDARVYCYDVRKSFAKLHVFHKHASYVTHIDFSSDGRFLQSTCGAYELLFSDAATGAHVTSASSMRDERWHTMTSTLGWSVQGIWPPSADGTDVNALDRSHDASLLATGDDHGRVNVFAYPCVLEKTASVALRGHASHVTNVRWSADDRALVSVGGNDKCVFVWRHERLGNAAATREAIDGNDSVDARDEALATGDRNAAQTHHNDPFKRTDDDDDVGDEFLAVKPWLGAIVAPTHANLTTLQQQSSMPPDARLELERVHGYEAQQASNNARFDASNNVVYHAAALGIIADRNASTSTASTQQRQRFFRGHTDDIVALCIHPLDRNIVATAQMGKRPLILVWNTATCATLACLEGFHQRFVSTLCFSSDGTKLGSVGGDDDHSIAIYAWQASSPLLVASAKGERSAVKSMCHVDKAQQWITCGDKHVRFWTQQGAHLTSKKGVFGAANKHKNHKLPSAFESVVAFGTFVVVGTSNGDLYIFSSGSNELSRVVTAHTASAAALYASTSSKELVSGGKDGTIMIWDADVKLLTTVDLRQQSTTTWQLWNAAIRSVCTSDRSARQLLVGTAGSDLLEVDASRTSNITVRVITHGHYAGEVWGLACHPQRAEYCTVGDDATLRVWCLQTKTQLRVMRLECAARACAIGPTVSVDMIAIGFGGGASTTTSNAKAKATQQSKTGSILLVHYSDLSCKVFEDRPSKQAISDVAFAPSGSVLAVGSHDHRIYLYKLQRDTSTTNNSVRVTKTATFAKHTSYITHLDFSNDSKYLQSTCGAYELLFCDVATGRHVTSASSTRDTQWHAWTCTLGWPVQGIWPPSADGTDVNAVDRSRDSSLLVTADDFGLVKLFRYPCVGDVSNTSGAYGSKRKVLASVGLEHRGHASHVTNVRWSLNDAFVVSVGGNDRCVFEWRVMRDADSAAAEVSDRRDVFAGGSSSSSSSSVVSGAMNAVSDKLDTFSICNDDNDDNDDDTDDFASDPAAAGDEFLAVKPWLGAIVAPSNAPTPNARAPDVRLTLDWVYGYQTELSRQNLVYNDSDEIVYHTAAIGVIYDPIAHLQRHHVGHNDDILSFAIPSVRRDVVATGERGKKPVVRLWDAHAGTLRCELKGVHARGVVSLAFNADATLLASVGDDDDHSVALWSDASHGSWTVATLLATAKGDKGVNCFAAFCGGGSSAALVTGGAKHVLFWRLDGKTLTAKRGRVGKRGTLQTFPCGAAFAGNVVTGTVSGELYVWRGDEVSQIVQAHDGECSVVHVHGTNDGSSNAGASSSRSGAASNTASSAPSSVLLTGGKDGRVVLWNTSFQSLQCFDLAAMSVSCLVKSIVSVCLSGSGHTLLIGTRSSDIVEVDVATGTLLHNGRPLFSGHYAHELWGLAVHPTRREFTTTGDDNTLRVWDMDTKQLVRVTRLPTKARACAYAPDGSLLAVGLGGGGGGGTNNSVRRSKANKANKTNKSTKLGDGSVLLLTAATATASPLTPGGSVLEQQPLTVVFEDSPATEWISDVKFAPDGSLVAFGSHDNAIYLYALQRSLGGGGIHSTNDSRKPVNVHKRKAFAKHNSYITHIDFSSDSTYLQSTCGAYELLFSDVATTSSHVCAASALRNTQWHSWTCPLGWPVQGIWPECADGTDVNAVCATASRTILATGDDAGLVKLFRYPCTVKGSKWVAGRGHASHVTNVRFSYDDTFLVSVGGNDRTICQWKLA